MIKPGGGKERRNVLKITGMEKGEEERKKREINHEKGKGKYSQRHRKAVNSLQTATKA